jgi:hypothetical protein
VGGCCAYTSVTWKAGIKELLGQVHVGNWGMCSPLGSIRLTRSGHEILVGLIKRLELACTHRGRMSAFLQSGRKRVEITAHSGPSWKLRAPFFMSNFIYNNPLGILNKSEYFEMLGYVTLGSNYLG